MDDRTSQDRTALIIAGGDPINPAVVASLPTDAWTIAADSGLEHAIRLGLSVDLVIGDMDSVDPSLLECARRDGAQVQSFSADKDATDLELAIGAAVDAGATRLILVGGEGGRFDHLLGNALLLVDPRLTNVSVEWRLGPAVVRPLRPASAVHLTGTPGDIVSIIPTGGPAIAVHTTGLRWALDGDTLHAGSTRGISNVLLRADATVRLEDGSALVIHQRSS